jgi:hypothetical protein
MPQLDLGPYGKHEGESDTAYLQRKVLEYRAKAALRPTKPQDGHADLPLFHTDLEDFTRKE